MTSHREIALPVDLKIIEQTLIENCGCVAAAARVLGVPSVDLRRRVASRPSLADAVYEATEQALDAAEKTLLDGLDDENPMTRLKAAAYFLRSSDAGRRRGFGRRAAGRSSSRPVEQQAVNPQMDRLGKTRRVTDG
jgi:hypothetical protein